MFLGFNTSCFIVNDHALSVIQSLATEVNTPALLPPLVPCWRDRPWLLASPVRTAASSALCPVLPLLTGPRAHCSVLVFSPSGARSLLDPLWVLLFSAGAWRRADVCIAVYPQHKSAAKDAARCPGGQQAGPRTSGHCCLFTGWLMCRVDTLEFLFNTQGKEKCL